MHPWHRWVLPGYQVLHERSAAPFIGTVILTSELKSEQNELSVCAFFFGLQ
jgi:hypothetical protein